MIYTLKRLQAISQKLMQIELHYKCELVLLLLIYAC